ncbi:MAG TPA: hypothetical protein VLC72_01480 [Nitrosopumilaceae archaeon]|nr:hypothetical protein [Nitrosopumilaceae archaeon]
MKNKYEKFDPDKLVLSKNEILDFCDRVIRKWNKNPEKHANHIFAMNAVKTSIFWTDDDSLKEIWGEILKWSYDLLYENAVAQANEEDVDWGKLLKKLRK